jgi:hypothetical protein
MAKRVTDRRILRLVRSFLTAGVLVDGLVGPTEEGTPQGGPLSPLLSNLMLDVLDKELTRRGHRFVRYADDCNIYVRSRRAGERVMTSVTGFVTKRLKLQVNTAKSAVDLPSRRKFLGFSFTAGKASPRRRIAPQALARFKTRVRALTRRTKGASLEQTIDGQEAIDPIREANRARRPWRRKACASTSRGGWATSASVRRRRCCASCTSGSDEGYAPSPGSNGAMGGTGSGSCPNGAYRAGSRPKPRAARTVPGGSLPARPSTWRFRTQNWPRSAFPP